MKLLGVIEVCTIMCVNFVTAFSMASPCVAAAAVTWELCSAQRGNVRTRTRISLLALGGPKMSEAAVEDNSFYSTCMAAAHLEPRMTKSTGFAGGRVGKNCSIKEKLKQ